MHLYETHLPVADTEKSREFYVNVLGLEFGYHGRNPHRCHFAIAVPLAELLIAGKRLNSLGIPTHNFAGEETSEPSVIGWMPSAQLYFRDPDGHSLEFITILDDPPEAAFQGPFSKWRERMAQ